MKWIMVAVILCGFLLGCGGEDPHGWAVCEAGGGMMVRTPSGVLLMTVAHMDCWWEPLPEEKRYCEESGGEWLLWGEEEPPVIEMCY